MSFVSDGRRPRWGKGLYVQAWMTKSGPLGGVEWRIGWIPIGVARPGTQLSIWTRRGLERGWRVHCSGPPAMDAQDVVRKERLEGDPDESSIIH